MSNIEFADQACALVVGASRGIGLALTRALLEDARFERVIATCRHPGQADQLAGLASSAGQPIDILPVDVTDALSIEALGRWLDERSLKPSLLIHAAGVLHDGPALQPEKRLEDLAGPSLARVLAVNTIGPALVLQAVLPRMARSGSAVAVVISARVGSISDNRLGGWYAYRASKAAVNQIVVTAAIEARRRFKQCIVVSLHPGTTDTGLSEPFQANVPAEKLFSADYTAGRLLAVIGGLEKEDSGSFFAWDGQRIPW